MVKLSTSLLFTLIFTIFCPFSSNTLFGTLIGLVVLLILIASISSKLRSTGLLILAGMTLGVTLSLPKLYHYQATYHLLPQTAHYQFKISKIFKQSQSIEAVIQGDQYLNGYTIRIYNVNNDDLLFDGVYSAQLTIQPNQARGNFYRSSQRLQHLTSQRIGTANLKLPMQLVQLPSTITKIRTKTANHFQEASYSNTDIMSALTVGLTNNISTSTWELFRQTGTIHLISISGLHLTFIALWCFIILRITFGALMVQKPAPYQIAAVLSLGVALGYALLAGMSLPTQRALIMFCIFMVALLLRYPILSVESLATALVIVLIIAPFSVLTIGFWLSFTSVLVLILLNHYRFSLIISLLLTQFIISTLAIPIVGSFFGEVSLISPITNLFAIPWTTIFILPFLLIGMVLLPIFPSLADSLFNLSNWSITQLLQFLHVMNQLPYSHINVGYIPILAAISITILALLLLTQIHFQIKISCALGLLITIALTFKPDREEYLLLFPVGEGLSALLKAKNTTLLFDTGRYYRGFDSGKSIIIPTLNNIGIQSLDYLVLSHNNQQHVGGTRSIRRAYPNTKVIRHSSLNELIEDGTSCADFNIDMQILTIQPLNTTKSCALKVMLNQQLIWLIADITPQEWRSLIRDNDRPNIVLFPNQGRSRGFMVPKDWGNVIFLASTKQIHSSYQPLQIQNAHTGAIKVRINNQGTTIKSSSDATRFWWMRPAELI